MLSMNIDLSYSLKNQLNSSSSSQKILRTSRQFTLMKMTRYSINSVILMATFTFVILLFSIVSIECHFKRTQYHEQGIYGPKSYKFGYITGDHKNPQERHEVSDGNGHVKGYYSYIDAYGKHQVVHYEAHPKYGFKVYNHKSKAHDNGKRHYGT